MFKLRKLKGGNIWNIGCLMSTVALLLSVTPRAKADLLKPKAIDTELVFYGTISDTVLTNALVRGGLVNWDVVVQQADFDGGGIANDIGVWFQHLVAPHNEEKIDMIGGFGFLNVNPNAAGLKRFQHSVAHQNHFDNIELTYTNKAAALSELIVDIKHTEAKFANVDEPITTLPTTPPNIANAVTWAIPYSVDAAGNVTWGGDTTDIILDTIPAGGKIKFFWTSGTYIKGLPVYKHPKYQTYEDANDTTQPVILRFHRPDDDTITDWCQVVTGSNGKSKVYGGNIQRDSPWSFHPLSELPDEPWRIPDLAPNTADPELTIYTAVNLELYLSNPNGFLDGEWTTGQTLDELGITIIDGQVPGLAGIYWATSDFTFDPDSETGWVPVDGNSAWLNSNVFHAGSGNIEILAEHKADTSTFPNIGSIIYMLLLAQ